MNERSATSYDCIVVGAGIAGVCAAIELQKRGACVALVDRNPPGSGASFGNAGILVNTNLRPVFAGLTLQVLFSMLRNPASPLNVRWSRFPIMVPWFLRMLRHARPGEVERITLALASLCQPGAELYRELLAEAGASDLVVAKGSVALNRSAEERDANWEKMSQLREMGVDMQKVDRNDLQSLVPSVSQDYTYGIFSPRFQHALDTQVIVTKLFELFCKRGGTFLSTHVEALKQEGSRITGIRTRSGEVQGNKVVVAAGTGSAAFARQVGETVPHQAVGGYHIMLRDPGVVLDRPILPIDFRFAITPMAEGIRLAGIYEFGGEGLEPKDSLITSMLSHIGKVLPGIRTDNRTTWRGFRSYLPDGLPIISPSQRREGLFYMFGFSSSGMINGAASGVTLAQIVTGMEPGIDPAPFSIARFT